MSILRVALAGSFLLLAACGGKKDEPKGVCDLYAGMEVKCNGGEGVRSIARSTCEDALKERDTDGFSAMIALEADCAQTETTCETYAACVEKKKDETTPPGM